jgi:radical SAM superfamily enzyme YgiQ (UPF0313 family)
LKVEEIEPALKMCKSAGLEPHVTFMIGYPWETKADAKKTVEFAKSLFKKGIIDSLQATLVIPYPGTPLYKYCQENKLLNFLDYSRLDQGEAVMKCELASEDAKKLIRDIYKSCITPKFLLRKIISIRSTRDLRYLWVATRKFLGHSKPFQGGK